LPHLPSFPTRRSSDLLVFFAKLAFSLGQVVQCSCLTREVVQKRETIRRKLPGADGGGPVLLLGKFRRLVPGSFCHTCRLRGWLRSEEHTSELQSPCNL